VTVSAEGTMIDRDGHPITLMHSERFDGDVAIEPILPLGHSFVEFQERFAAFDWDSVAYVPTQREMSGFAIQYALENERFDRRIRENLKEHSIARISIVDEHPLYDERPSKWED
jgi:hypothetical protein